LLINLLMTAHSTLAEQIATYDLQVRELAKTDQTIGRLMTTAGCRTGRRTRFASSVDDPQRFARATDVGAYLGVTPRRYQSCDLAQNGRITKRGNRLTRFYPCQCAPRRPVLQIYRCNG
jgi:transposase